MSNFGLPYRPPCGGWPDTPRAFSNGCYQHTRASEQDIQHWHNATTATATGEPPISGPGAWTPADLNACAPDDGTHHKVDLNCYVLSEGLFDNLSRCRKLGFKAVQGQKTWHGKFGFNVWDGCTVDVNGLGCQWEKYHPVAPTTKYLTLDSNATFRVRDYPRVSTNPDTGKPTYDTTPDTDDTSTCHRKATINKNSGVQTWDICAEVDAGGNLPTAQALAVKAMAGWPCELFNIYGPIISNWKAYVADDPLNRSLNITGLGTTAQVATLTSDHSALTGPFNDAVMSIDLEAGTLDCVLHTVFYDEDPVVYELHIALGETTLSYSETSTSLLSENKRITDSTLTATLSNPYSQSNVQADLVELMASWDLTDDAVYPWRTDNYVTRAPLVCRNEAPGSPDINHDCDWIDPNAATFDGSIFGQPNPAGYENHFAWHHQELPFPDCAGATVYGEWTPNILPQNATEWTEQCIAKQLWPGAWLWHSQGILRGQKWAEIKIHRPAINFFRPCGADRFEVDASTARCVASIEGTTVTLTSGVTTVNTGDLVLINADGTMGVYPVTKTSDTVYELGALARSLPDDAPPYAVQFGKIRWPNAWSICGRLQVSGASAAGGTVSVTLADAAKYLRTGDAVDFTDAGGAVTDANKTVTVVDETHFTYAGGAAPTGIYVKSHGAPAYWWFDDDSKGDYLAFTWLHNFRDIGEGDRVCEQHAALVLSECANNPDVPGDVTCNGDESTGCDLRQNQATHGMPRSVKDFNITEDCLGFSPCWPQVVCFSPNGEVFELGNTYAFPGSGTFKLDDRYGSLWQGAVEFVMPDPFWEAPPPPCPAPDSWVEDPGDCTADYAHRPMVEARQSMPAPWVLGDTAPTLPVDVIIHILTLAELDSGSPPDGIVMAPPAAVGDTLTAGTQWGLWLAEVSCVCLGGAFFQDYKDNGVSVNCPS